jgi:hypothetical protein
METQRFSDSEKELRVAVAQSPGNLVAHELLARLYRTHLDRPADAFAQEGRARSLRHELSRRESPPVDPGQGLAESIPSEGGMESHLPEGEDGPGAHSVAAEAMPAAFDDAVDPKGVITIVSGLPRSGTSMMMQVLRAAGLGVLTDDKRQADEDNPLGYLEFEKSLSLAKDRSWLSEARGKAVKVVAQLLTQLPSGEHYNIIFMERDLGEVIASQRVMLDRQGRRGADLDDATLVETYKGQLRRVRRHVGARAEIRVLNVDYGKLLADPAGGVERVAKFLALPFDREAAVNSIRPELRRQKS